MKTVCGHGVVRDEVYCQGEKAHHRHIAEHAGSKQEGSNDLPHNIVGGQGRVGERLQTHSPVGQGLPCRGVLLSGNLSFCGHLQGQVEGCEAVLVLALEELGLQQARQQFLTTEPLKERKDLSVVLRQSWQPVMH